MEAVYLSESPKETIRLGEKLGARLKGGDVVLLFGELGAGKTHFIKGIAEGLDVSATVKSPTYAYVNRYDLNEAAFYHYDLYRLGDNVTPTPITASLSSIGYDESLDDSKAINVVEWADRLGGNLPRSYIKVEIEGGGDVRKIRIEFIGSRIPSQSVIHQLYEEWVTPQHVRAHIKQVSHVAMQLAQAFIEKGEIINMNLLHAASMLHDISRVCDFRTLERDKFQEDVTDEKWKKWESCRLEYHGVHHADIACDQLRKLGFPEVAEVVRLHRSVNIVDEPDSYNTPEKKILYYSDKRVKHDEIVDLDERFRDGWERYGQYDDDQTRERFEQVEKKTYQLEKELFKGLSIKPSDIQ
ncbi:tRNA (adenosine(37)-N6)-threonylcarbamoyltransferase complex ATPase subunit type 1 TsaE [Candidatus Peregrinibacteria bacterium]|nr:tRNA (adenosine(37)-N6)-threonylcarbamoyltransferase complex ATPase subunit type 1 TsaE [Candidatus Peregrinibacteria bacterium]